MGGKVDERIWGAVGRRGRVINQGLVEAGGRRDGTAKLFKLESGGGALISVHFWEGTTDFSTGDQRQSAEAAEAPMASLTDFTGSCRPSRYFQQNCCRIGERSA